MTGCGHRDVGGLLRPKWGMSPRHLLWLWCQVRLPTGPLESSRASGLSTRECLGGCFLKCSELHYFSLWKNTSAFLQLTFFQLATSGEWIPEAVPILRARRGAVAQPGGAAAECWTSGKSHARDLLRQNPWVSSVGLAWWG